MKTIRWGLAAVALATAMGCTTKPGSPTLPSSPHPTVTSPTSNRTPRPVQFPAGPDDLCAPLVLHIATPPGDGPLPRSSTVIAARWCVQVFTVHGPRVELRQATGGLAALDRALHAPGLPPLPTTMACAAVGHAAFTLEVLDQHGRLTRPTPPVSQCGDPAATRDALAATASAVLLSQTPTTQ